jgi:MscS family membrane protein
LGFLAAAHNGNYEAAAQYLNTNSQGKSAARLAQELFVVMDRGLPPRLNNLSNDPEGSLSYINPKQDLVGAVESSSGKVDIIVERVNRGKGGPIWLFSRHTLTLVSDLYEEIEAIAVENLVPDFLLNNFLGFSLIGWLCFFVGLPLLYLVTILFNRLLGALAGFSLRRRHKRSDRSNPTILPHPVRLLAVAFILRWSLSHVSISLLARQFWSATVTIITIVGCVWLSILLSKRFEVHVKRQLERRNAVNAISLIRPVRRITDLIFVIVGLFVFLFTVGVNPTAAVAGLGVGGIAVALAAQKTLENVIGGASIILDRVVQVGEFLKIGDIQGTVEQIGLRSTKLRSLNRSIITIPNGQMATITLENFSSRDTFWFHHIIGLSYETTAFQLSSILTDIRNLLAQHPKITADSLRVQFFRLGQSSLEIDIFAYVPALDWPDFLTVQEELLLRIMNLVEANGATIAIPSQMVYVAHSRENDATARQPLPSAVRGGKSL